MAAMTIRDTVKLNNGVAMPRLGIGTWRTPSGKVAEDSVKWALHAGYIHVDTAALYENEESVGKAIRESGGNKSEIFVTTKIWNDDIRSGKIEQALDASLKKLGMETVDLYLIHWPVPGKFIDCWLALETLYKKGKARAIGVSNFLVHHLEELAKASSLTPAVNQVEWHPWARQQPLLDYCAKHKIVFEAWAPLIQGKITEVQSVVDIARAKGKSPAQVAIRWGLQHDVVMIPKSVHQERIIENCGVYDFELSADEMKRIDAADKNQRVGPDPDNFNF